MAMAKRQGREKPAKIKQRKVKERSEDLYFLNKIKL